MKFHIAVFLCTLSISRPASAQQTQVPPSAPSDGTARTSKEPKAAPETKPASAPSSFAEALNLYNAGRISAAAHEFERIIQHGGADVPTSYAWLARADLGQFNVVEAEAAARKSLELSPNLATAHAAMGEVYFRQAKFAEAEVEFLTPLKAGIPDPRAYLGLARLSWASSYYKHAKQLIDKAHALDPRDPDITVQWMRTQPRVQRMKLLQGQLAADPKMDEREKETELGELKKLEEQQAHPAPSCRMTSAVSSTEAPFENLAKGAQQLQGLGLKVMVNGTPSKLLLDTGAAGILVNTKIAERAGLKKVADAPVEGIGNQGAASGYVGYADSIQVGALEFQGCPVRVLDRKRAMDEDGYIGADVFENYLVELNFPDRKLKLSQLPKRPDADTQQLGLKLDSDGPEAQHDRYIAPEMQSYLKFYRFGHYILLPTMVNTTTNSRLFLVDTGSEQVLLGLDLARQVTKVRTDEWDILRGASGRVQDVYKADAVKLAFGKLMLQADDVVAFDLTRFSNGAGTEISGFLGFSLLFQLDIKIDYRDGLISFQYDPNRLH
jgi:predicted aspartyl protease